MDLERRIEDVRSRIAAAARRAGRDPDDVTLVAVTKTVSVDVIRRARDAGLRVFGENRVQEAESKIGEVSGVSWHFVGRLQSNKARRAAGVFDLIHSLDSVRLGERLDRLGREAGRPVDALVEVNVGGEESKSGVSPGRLPELLETLCGREGLAIHGLMTVPPPAPDPDAARGHFRTLRALAEAAEARSLPGLSMRHLSMGMSADFEVAVEEGATLVRVGTSIFGARPS